MASDTHELVNIAEAFERHRENKSKHLYVLMNQLKDQTLPSSTLLKYLKQLSQLVQTLNKDFEVLVGFILKMDWTIREPEIIEEYLLLVKNIVSVHSFYLSASVRMIIDHFKPKHYNPLLEITDEMRNRNEVIFQKLHMLLSSICKTVPMSPVILIPLLTESFPFYLSADYILECYVSNLYKVTSYLPKHRSQILLLIISELTKMDVHVPVSDALNGSLTRDKSSMAVSDNVDTNRVMCKLDILMNITFAYIKDTCIQQDVPDMPRTQKLLGDFLQVFEAVLLPTYACRFVQYIIFYVCSFHECTQVHVALQFYLLSPLTDLISCLSTLPRSCSSAAFRMCLKYFRMTSKSLAVEFLEILWKKFEDPNLQGVFRQIAVLYIASYLVRAKNISTHIIKVYVDKLVAWVRRYIQLSPQNSRPDIRRHGPFYSACQALFYIFIYRHEELLHTYGLKYCESLYLGSVVTSWLNPLRMCLPQVAAKFASVVRHNRVAFCDTVLDRNRRYQLPEVHSVLDDGGASSVSRHVDAYFPFDPFTLPRSSLYIVDIYRNVESLYSETRRHRTMSEDVKQEEELYMDCDENSDSYNSFDLKLYGTSPGVMR